MAAPISNGAIVEDQTTSASVAVNFNFSNTGTGGGVLQVLQSTGLFSISSGMPTDSDLGWVNAVDAYGNPPSEGAQSTWSHVGFNQPRGTKLYYYSRRINGTTIQKGSPYPVTEIVPSKPYITGVQMLANDTVAVVNAIGADSLTTLYYYASTSPAEPNYALTNAAQAVPPSYWSTSNNFSVTPGQTYYFWVLGWTHNNPGPDGAVISSRTTRYSGTSGYGIEVNGEPYTYGTFSVVERVNLVAGSHYLWKNNHPDITDYRFMATPVGVRDTSLQEVRPYFLEYPNLIAIVTPSNAGPHVGLILGR